MAQTFSVIVIEDYRIVEVYPCIPDEEVSGKLFIKG